MKKRWNRMVSIIINSILIGIDFIIILQSFIQWLPKEEDKILWYQAFTYYTEDSNIALFIGAIAMLVANILLLRGKRNIRILSILKYLGVVATMVTFVTVYVFMIAFKNPALGFSTTGNLWLFAHTICPILGLSSYLFFDEGIDISYRHTLIPIGFTILYTILILLTYALGGRLPYVMDFENDYSVNGWFILLLGVIETTLTAIIALLIRYFKNIWNRGRSGKK